MPLHRQRAAARSAEQSTIDTHLRPLRLATVQRCRSRSPAPGTDTHSRGAAPPAHALRHPPPSRLRALHRHMAIIHRIAGTSDGSQMLGVLTRMHSKQCVLAGKWVAGRVLEGVTASVVRVAPSAGATQRLRDCSTTGCSAWPLEAAPPAAGLPADGASGCGSVRCDCCCCCCCCCRTPAAAGGLALHWPAPSSRAAAMPGLPRSPSGCGGGSHRTAQSWSK